MQKYNIATGLINELIENYNIQVIIICNIDILGYDYVDKVFRGKLDCITYNKSVDENSIESIFKSTFKNQVYSNKDVERLVSKHKLPVYVTTSEVIVKTVSFYFLTMLYITIL